MPSPSSSTTPPVTVTCSSDSTQQHEPTPHTPPPFKKPHRVASILAKRIGAHRGGGGRAREGAEAREERTRPPERHDGMHQHVQPGRRGGVRRRAAAGAGPAHLLLQRLRRRAAAAAAGAEQGDEPEVPGGGPELRVLGGQPPHDGSRPALLQGQDPSPQGRLHRRAASHDAPRRAPRRRREGVGQGIQPVEGDARPAEAALRRRRRQWHHQEEHRRRRRHGHRRCHVQAGAMM